MAARLQLLQKDLEESVFLGILQWEPVTGFAGELGKCRVALKDLAFRASALRIENMEDIDVDDLEGLST